MENSQIIVSDDSIDLATEKINNMSDEEYKDMIDEFGKNQPVIAIYPVILSEDFDFDKEIVDIIIEYPILF